MSENQSCEAPTVGVCYHPEFVARKNQEEMSWIPILHDQWRRFEQCVSQITHLRAGVDFHGPGSKTVVDGCDLWPLFPAMADPKQIEVRSGNRTASCPKNPVLMSKRAKDSKAHSVDRPPLRRHRNE